MPCSFDSSNYGSVIEISWFIQRRVSMLFSKWGEKEKKAPFFHNAIQTPGFKVNLSNASIKQTEIELYYIEMYLLCLLCEPYIFVLALFTKVGWPYSKLNSL